MRSCFNGCNNLTLFYCGSAEEWDNVSHFGIGVADDKVYFYSQSEPTTDGNYWYFAEDGSTPVAWLIKNA